MNKRNDAVETIRDDIVRSSYDNAFFFNNKNGSTDISVTASVNGPKFNRLRKEMLELENFDKQQESVSQFVKEKQLQVNDYSNGLDSTHSSKIQRVSELKKFSKSKYDYDSAYSNSSNVSSSADVLRRNNNTWNMDDIEGLSTTSSIPETDLDAENESRYNRTPLNTLLFGNGSNYYNKTKSLSDLSKSPVNFQSYSLSRAVSNEIPQEESEIFCRLKEKAKSKNELRIAESLTKLNIPIWMSNFKDNLEYNNNNNNNITQRYYDRFTSVNNSKRSSLRSVGTLDLKLNQDRINSKFSSLNREVKTSRKMCLPSQLYRSKSQNLDLFNPNTDSQLKLNKIKAENTSNLKSLKFDQNKTPEVPIKLKESLIPPVKEFSTKITPEKIKKETKVVNDLTVSPNETNHIKSSSIFNGKLKPKIEMNAETEKFDVATTQAEVDNESLIKIISQVNNDCGKLSENLYQSLSINPNSLKLLVNVKRKTPNLNRDESYLSNKEYSLHIKHNEESCQMKMICNLATCKNILNINMAKHLVSCYNCFTYYCSKVCRNQDINNHKLICSFQRIKIILDRLRKSLTNKQLYNLFLFSRENYAKSGKGIVILTFESSRAAEDFMDGHSNRLVCPPFYLAFSSFNSLKSFDNYNPETEVVIGFIVFSTQAAVKIEMSYPIFRLISKYHRSLFEEYLNVPEKRAIIDNSNSDENKNITFFNYVIEYFRKRSIDLQISHPKIYQKLQNYAFRGIEFDTINIFVKDPVSRSTISCLITPDKDISAKIVKSISYSNSTENKIKEARKSVTETEI